MKKFRFKLYMVFITIFILSFGIFFGGYLLLNDNYINDQAGNNFVYMTDAIAVNFNLQVDKEYKNFENVVDENYTTNISTSELFDKVNSSLDDITISSIKDNINIGYVSKTIDDKGKEVYEYHIKEGSEIKEYLSNPKYDNYLSFYNDKVSIYKLSYLFDDNTDTNNYIFFKYKDVFIYFSASDYLNSLLANIDGIPSSTYLVFQKDGIVLLEQNSNVSNTKFYLEYILGDNFKYKYDQIAEKLYSGTSGFGIFNIDDEKCYFVFSPVLSELLNEPLFIGYKMRFDEAIVTMNYVRIILGIIFGTLFLIFNIVFIISGINYVKKDADVSLSRINSYYIKPFSVIMNRKGKIVSMNKTFRVNVNDLNKYQYITDFDLRDDDEEHFLEYVKKQHPFTVTVQSIDKSTMYIHFIPVKTGFKYILLGENITESINEGMHNRQIALYNSVTNLPNKNLLDKGLHELVSTGAINNNNYSLIAIDVVDFNKINRIFGFSAADKMLQEISRILENSLTDFDHTIYNIRTSLFMVILKKVITYNDVITWSKKCLAIFSEPINIKDDYLTSIEIKMGIFNIEPKKMDGCDPFKIYECATTALDRAKNSRLTKCAIYSAEFGRMLTRDQIMEEDLRQAIANREFVMFYQAQYNTKQNKVVGFEALVRWNNPKYKLESVEHFISLAEKNGMIVEIGRIIIEETFKFAKSIEKTGIHISMNVSPVQLLQSGFVNDLINMFDEFGLKPGSVAVEITETFLMENSEAILAKLKLLRDKGFSIHLDDFGIGYSSMLYLKDLPVDVIKIDKEFVKHVLTDRFSRIIVSKVVQIALNLNLDIIAEGIETEKQSQLLSKMGCNIIQGYLISKPVPEEEAMKLITKYSNDQDKLVDKNKKSKSKNKEEENDDLSTDEVIDKDIEDNTKIEDIIDDSINGDSSTDKKE